MSLQRIVLAVVLLGIGSWIGLLWLEESHGPRPYSRIEDKLYLGESVPKPPSGTRAVVNLCEKKDPYEVAHTLSEPIDGGKAPTLAWLRKVVDFIHARLQGGTTTYPPLLPATNPTPLLPPPY